MLLEDSMALTPVVTASRTRVAARWLVAGAAVALATTINFAVHPATGGRAPFLPYFPALVFVGVYAGTLPALVTLGASGLIAWYCWIPPFLHLGPLTAKDGITLLLFFIAGGAVISISARARADRPFARVPRGLAAGAGGGPRKRTALAAGARRRPARHVDHGPRIGRDPCF
jgi:K+-sensing histidine kinase KdpD